MKIINIKERKNQYLLQKSKKSLPSKSTLVTDITELVLQFKKYNQGSSLIKQEQQNSVYKGKIFCEIIQQCQKSQSNQLLLCSILGIPFIPGPAALNSISSLYKNKNINNQNINKQIIPLLKYLRKINQNQSYYCWIIYQDTQLNILNVKLFTKWEFKQLKKHCDHLYLSQKRLKNNKGCLTNDSGQQYYLNQDIQWNYVMLGVFIEEFSDKQVIKERIHSVLQRPKPHISHQSSLIKQDWGYDGLSTKTTKQSFNKTSTIENNKTKDINKNKSISMKGKILKGVTFHKPDNSVSNIHEGFKKQKLQFKNSKSEIMNDSCDVGKIYSSNNIKAKNYLDVCQKNLKTKTKASKNQLQSFFKHKKYSKDSEQKAFVKKDKSMYLYEGI